MAPDHRGQISLGHAAGKTESKLKQARRALNKSSRDVGLAQDAACGNASGSGGKRPLILRAPSTATRQLGL